MILSYGNFLRCQDSARPRDIENILGARLGHNRDDVRTETSFFRHLFEHQVGFHNHLSSTVGISLACIGLGQSNGLPRGGGGHGRHCVKRCTDVAVWNAPSSDSRISMRSLYSSGIEVGTAMPVLCPRILHQPTECLRASDQSAHFTLIGLMMPIQS